MESVKIPNKVIRKFIFDVLIERSNKIMDDCEELINEDLEQIGVANDYSISVGWEACGTRVLADDVLSGVVSVEEAMEEILSVEEIKYVKANCLEWLKDNKETVKI